jgi:peroxiredoxin-like protein
MSQYVSTALWTKGRNGIAGAQGAKQTIGFSAPVEFQGRAGEWTPEHFLMAAVASCFITTFAAIAEFSKFGFMSLEVSATGTLEKVERGFQFTRITLRPVLAVGREEDRERALRLIEKTERSCLVSRSLRSEVTVEPAVDVRGVAGDTRDAAA